MLNAPTLQIAPRPIEFNGVSGTANQWSIAVLIGILRHRRKIIVRTVAVTLLIALAYLMLAKDRFTAATELVLDTKRASAFPAETAPDALVDMSVVESHVEMIRSEKVALAVVRKLGLESDPEFIAPGRLGNLLAKVGIAPETFTAEENVQRAVDGLKRRLKVNRVGRSYVTEILFTSTDPAKAARIANEVAEAYIQDQFDSKLVNAQRTNAWMQQRITELRTQVSNASREFEDFKSENAAATRQGQVRMRELEAAAQTYKTIYETFLNRYTQALQQQSFPGTEARIITAATPPLGRSSPDVNMTLFVALTGGLILGIALAFTREHLDRTVRSATQLDRLGIRPLGAIPVDRRRVRANAVSSLLGNGKSFSPGEETLHRIRAAVDQRDQLGRGRLIGITSPNPGEGKTTIAYNLAVLLARSQKKVLLLDADFRKSLLSRWLLGNAEFSLIDVVENRIRLPQAVVARQGFDFLGTRSRPGQWHPSDVLGSPGMRDLLATARKTYEYVIIDLATILPHADVGVMASSLDAIVLTAEHARTTIDAIDQAIASSSEIADRLLGVVINKVKADHMPRT